MKRRIRLVGAALSVTPLAFGVAGAAAAPTKPKVTKPKIQVVHATCTTNVSTTIAPGDTGVTPPAPQGDEYGVALCAPLGRGVQADSFTVPDSGDTVAKFTMYFGAGAIRGTYDLTPQEGSFPGGTNFLQVDYLGTMVITGGTGAWDGVKGGTGTMTCTTADGGIHTSCTDKFSFKLLVKPTKTA